MTTVRNVACKKMKSASIIALLLNFPVHKEDKNQIHKKENGIQGILHF